MPGIDTGKQFVPLKIAVLTVSDTRDLADDKSGATLVERIVGEAEEIITGRLAGLVSGDRVPADSYGH